ncbi:hypothetical protein H5410_046873 [Solanum commersonii]|uniref:Uncharacterized protein n=1 Tax=Solanum commersonii TaxID=4109 RepID=A0A9J5XFL9_SOLCO|nr:hypothetical protein H5410_046873 [Solanum commersonii]
MYSPGGILNALATALHGSIRTMPSIHHLRLGLLGYLIPDTVIASSLGKEVHDPWAFYLYAALLRQAFAHCGKFPTAASRRSLGRVSVPVWLIILSDQLLIIALSFPTVVPLPRAGSYALLTRPPLETSFLVFPVRLAYVKHAASVHLEPGSNSP